VGFGQSDIPSVVGYILSAAKAFCSANPGEPPGDKRRGLIKTEAAENVSLVREIMVNTNQMSFVQAFLLAADEIATSRPADIGKDKD